MISFTNVCETPRNRVVALGNEFVNSILYDEHGAPRADTSLADLVDVANDILLGAVQFWLYAQQVCSDESCTRCAVYRGAAKRMQALKGVVENAAIQSDYLAEPLCHPSGGHSR